MQFFYIYITNPFDVLSPDLGTPMHTCAERRIHVVVRQERYLPQQVQGGKVPFPSITKERMQMAPQRGEEMKHLLLICLCLIALIPKSDWEKGQDNWIRVLSEIYMAKHPGQSKATVTVGETRGGLIRIEICQEGVGI